MTTTLKLLERVISSRAEKPGLLDVDGRPSSKEIPRAKMIKPVRDTTIAYAEKFKGGWHKGEYDLERLQIAQDVEPFLGRPIRQKVDRFVTAGYEIVSENDEALFYIKQRLAHEAQATGRPFGVFLGQLFHDLVRFDQVMLYKRRDRDRSLGSPRPHHTVEGLTIEPIAGMFIIPGERLEFRSNGNGSFKMVRQRMPDGKYKDYSPADCVHIHVHKKPGFTMATPIHYAALDDILMLRRIEENVIELIETNLFPRFHYKVGTDDHPALYTREGEHEVDYVRNMISYMPPGAVYVSDHRQEIEVLGAENTALRIDYYLAYFRQRVFAAVGTSDVDMGIGGTSNRSTANTLSKGSMLSVEALQQILAENVNFYIINEMLMEGGFNPLDPADRVEIRFGIVDKEERIALENQVIQKFTNNVINLVEARAELGHRPPDDQWMEMTHHKLFAEPLALAKGTTAGSASSHALAETPQSNISPEGVKKEEQYAERQTRISKQLPAGKKGGSSSSKTSRSSSNTSRPRNQHGTRSSPKLTRDLEFDLGDRKVQFQLETNYEVDDSILDDWTKDVVSLYHQLDILEVRFESVLRNQLPKLHQLHEDTHED